MKIRTKLIQTLDDENVDDNTIIIERISQNETNPT